MLFCFICFKETLIGIHIFVLTEKLLHSDLDDRALDALKEFPCDGALAVLSQV